MGAKRELTAEEVLVSIKNAFKKYKAQYKGAGTLMKCMSDRDSFPEDDQVVTFSECVVTDAVFTEEEILNVEFNQVEFINCQFIGCNVCCTVFNHCTFTQCGMKDCVLLNCDIRRTDFSSTYLSSSKVKQCVFADNTFTKCTLSDIELDSDALNRDVFARSTFEENTIMNCRIVNVSLSMCYSISRSYIKYSYVSGSAFSSELTYDVTCCDLLGFNVSNARSYYVTMDDKTHTATYCQDTGSFAAWIPVSDYIVKVCIPETAQRYSTSFTECLVDSACVVSIETLSGATAVDCDGDYLQSIDKYTIGKTIVCDPDEYKKTKHWYGLSGIRCFTSRCAAVADAMYTDRTQGVLCSKDTV